MIIKQALTESLLQDNHSTTKNSHQFAEPSKDRKYYYDLEHKKLIAGRLALRRYLKEVSQHSEIYELRDLLLNDDINLPPPSPDNKKRTPRSRSELIRYGRWLCEVVGQPDNPKKRQLNEKIIDRAGKLGIGPTVGEILNPKNFGTLSNYYQHLGIRNAKKTGQFKNWSSEDFKNYIRSLAKELGRKPTRNDLINSYRNGGIDRPSLHVIISRFGKLNKLYELGGYINFRDWQEYDYIDWGIKFMEANNQLIPTQSLIDYFSKQKKCPSATTFAKKFSDSLSNYQNQLADAYEQYVNRQQQDRAQKLAEIESGKFPPELFQDAKTDEEKILRMAKYKVVDDLLTSDQQQSKISICTESIQSVVEIGFIRAIRKYAPHVTEGDIEHTALWMGVFDDIWPPDKSYLDELKIPQELLSPYRLAKVKNAAVYR
jgi:hypothetical protein